MEKILKEEVVADLRDQYLHFDVLIELREGYEWHESLHPPSLTHKLQQFICNTRGYFPHEGRQTHRDNADDLESFFLADIVRIRSFVDEKLTYIWTKVVNLALQMHIFLDQLADMKKEEPQTIAQILRQQTGIFRRQADQHGNQIVNIDAFIRHNVALGAYVAIKCSQDGEDVGGHVAVLEGAILGKNIHGTDPLMLALSDVYQMLRVIEEEGIKAKDVLQGAVDETWKAPQKFTRMTKKFWILPKDVARFKSEVIKHLPILVYGDRKKVTQVDVSELPNLKPISRPDSGQIASIYLDKIPELEHYHDRLHRKDLASVVRIRWYGDRDPKDDEKSIFIEQKVHRSAYTGLTSTKERGEIKQTDVPCFLRGQYRPLPTQRDAGFLQRAMESIESGEMEPLLRTTYSRTAFQESTNNLVRISLDKNLLMLKEYKRQGLDWCRDLHADPLTHKDSVFFPYGVVEIKLQSRPPEWVKDLIKTGILLVVPKFSKFLHGTASLYQDLTENVPYWFLPATDGSDTMTPATWDEMADQEDIYLKNAADWLFPQGFDADSAGNNSMLPFFRPRETKQSKKDVNVKAGLDDLCDESGNRTWCDAEQVTYPKPAQTHFASSGIVERTKTWPVFQHPFKTKEEDTSSSMGESSAFNDSARRKSSEGSPTCDNISTQDSKSQGKSNVRPMLLPGTELETMEYGMSVQGNQMCAPQPSQAMLQQSRELSCHLSGNAMHTDPSDYGVTQYTLSCQKVGGEQMEPIGGVKRVKSLVRTRVEPKTFFANERTFLQWLNISVLVMFLALSLLNGSSLIPGSGSGLTTACAQEDAKCIAGKMSGAIIAPVALMFMAYALFMYKKRTIQILRRETVRYDDQRGPVLLVVILLLVMTISYILTMVVVFQG